MRPVFQLAGRSAGMHIARALPVSAVFGTIVMWFSPTFNHDYSVS